MPGGAEPWGTYGENKQVHEEWGIDATLVDITGWGTYYVWSCMDDELQSLCIAKLVTPTSIGPFSILSQPTEEWERIEVPVNEGPAGLYHGNKTWIAYSASFCKTPDYVIATLLWDGIGDPLKASSWTKSSGPLFSSANGNYGTAHNWYVDIRVTMKRPQPNNFSVSLRVPMEQRSGTYTMPPKTRQVAVVQIVKLLHRLSTGMPMGPLTLGLQSRQVRC